MVTDPKSVRSYLAKIGEPTDLPGRSPSRGPLVHDTFTRADVLDQAA